MLKPIEAQLGCGCCFIVPPDVLRDLSRGQKVPLTNARTFQDSFLETVRLRQVREGHRVAALTGRLSVAREAVAHQAEQHLFDCRNRTSLPGRAVANPSTGAEAFQTVF